MFLIFGFAKFFICCWKCYDGFS